jgi:thioredoxin-dependent peroxiredoxin
MTVEAFVHDNPSPEPVRLADFRGRWLALAFFPPAAVPKELDKMQGLHGDLTESDCALLGVSYESWFELRETPTTFPLVADTEGILARRFGALVDGEPCPGIVLVDPDGIIRYEDLCGEISPERTLDALRGLRAAA